MRTEIPRSNLREFVARVSELVGYAFSDGDWDAIKYGAEQVSAQPGFRWTYPLLGATPVELRLGYEAADAIAYIELDLPDGLVGEVDAISRILSAYDATAPLLGLADLIAEEFGNAPRPPANGLMGCSPQHLAVCHECQEVKQIFGRTDWRGFDAETASWGYAGPGFLSPKARAHFLPAYVLVAVAGRDTSRLKDYLNLGVSGSDSWSLLQRRLIDFVLAIQPEPW